MNEGGNWSDIFNEIRSVPSSYDTVRHKYYVKLQELTQRNILCYYSGWQQGKQTSIDINDSDMEGIMSAVSGMDKKKGLTILLHTPGGDPTATESIVSYLREFFNDDIEVIVPHMAMSAGTMMACASKVIYMGKQSSLGPVDPQIGGLPAYNILEEFNEAYQDLKNSNENAVYWNILLSKYPSSFNKFAKDAIDLSEKLINQWLSEVMFADDPNKNSKVAGIVQELNEHTKSKAHGRHFNHKKASEIGLKIKLLEENQELQNIVLSLHHSFIISFQRTKASKIIEGPKSAYILFDNK